MATPLVRFASRQPSDELWDEHDELVRDVHDVVGSTMTAIHLQAHIALRALASHPAEAAEALRSIAASTERSLCELRSILGEHPATEPIATLEHIDTLVASISGGRLQVDIRLSGDVGVLPPAYDEAAYRIVQESLTNVLRHAEATAVRIAIDVAGGVLTINVDDDGVCWLESAAVSHLPGQGIRGMRARTKLLGGYLSARRGSAGFSVRAVLPLPHCVTTAVHDV